MFLFGQDSVQSLNKIIKKIFQKNYEKETPGVVNTCAYMGIQDMSPEAPKKNLSINDN